jgi:hemerythrin
MENLLMTSPQLKWTEEHSIGIESLDFEHRDLFNRINELLKDLASQRDKEEAEEFLGEIRARMEAHFALEEQFMKEKKYPGYAEHKREHDKFLDDFVDAMTQFENDPGVPHIDALETEVKRWIVDHVLHSDKAMSLLTTSSPP